MGRRAPRPCLNCGKPTHRARCDACAPPPRPKERRESSARRGYDRNWNRERLAFLAKPQNRICRICRKALATVVDHITPHRGDRRLFWDRSNWQPACIPCHNAKSPTEKTPTRSPNSARRDR